MLYVCFLSWYLFLRHLFYMTSQIMNKTDVKTTCKYKRCISFFSHSSKYEGNGSRANFTRRPPVATYFVRDRLRSYFDECQKNDINCLIIMPLLGHLLIINFLSDSINLHLPIYTDAESRRFTNYYRKCQEVSGS